MSRYDHEQSKLCPHCGGSTTFLHMLKEPRHESGWRHICKTCGDVGHIPDPPKTDQELMLEYLTKMKKRLARMAENGNPWPLDSDMRKVVRFSELQDPPSDEWKRGQFDAFNALWSVYCDLEAKAIDMGLIEGRIELDPQEDEAMPF
ncbi:hypothetical protein [Rhodobacter sp. NSM]|uniref:hypothetical protein n=1 Tax=Rhodobacter sp. NSM TaxID=3457501 RepID=UPI003FD32494